MKLNDIIATRLAPHIRDVEEKIKLINRRFLFLGNELLDEARIAAKDYQSRTERARIVQGFEGVSAPAKYYLDSVKEDPFWDDKDYPDDRESEHRPFADKDDEYGGYVVAGNERIQWEDRLTTYAALAAERRGLLAQRERLLHTLDVAEKHLSEARSLHRKVGHLWK